MKPVVCKYETITINSKKYITGWQIVPQWKWPDFIGIQMPSKAMNEFLKDEHNNWIYVLVDGKNVVEDRQPVSEERRRIEVNQQIQVKLPELMRIIANDDLKGFDNLKIEIKAIEQSVMEEKMLEG